MAEKSENRESGWVSLSDEDDATLAAVSANGERMARFAYPDSTPEVTALQERCRAIALRAAERAETEQASR